MIEGRPQPPNLPRPQVSIQFVSPDYFKAIGTPLLRGRAIEERDREDAMPAVVINEAMARRYFGDEDPIGRRVTLEQQHAVAGDEKWGTIVGVVGNVKEFALDKEPSEELFLPLYQGPLNGGTLFVRTTSDPWALVGPIREMVRRLDPKQPVGRTRTLEQVRAESLASPRLTTVLIGLFSLLALVITTAGIVGVVSYSVSQRTQEIGIRMALGADRGRVVQMVLRQGLAPVVIGMATGVFGALALTKLIAGLLRGVGPTDPMTFAWVLVGLFLVAAMACWQPARRAAGIEPMLALRSD
jgi:putative ABC transport system permease protein